MGGLPRHRRQQGWWAIGGVLVVGSAAVAVYLCWSRPGGGEAPSPPTTPAPTAAASARQIEKYCGTQCHAFPPPEAYPRWAWKDEVNLAYRIIFNSDRKTPPPARQDVIRYYEERAPLELPEALIRRATNPIPVRFEQTQYPVMPHAPYPAVANVNLVHLFDERRLDVLACDMRAGLVSVLKPYEATPAWKVLARVPNPCHAEVVDLDGDGIKDILVANLGSMDPQDHFNGSVVWLRGLSDGTFRPITLLKNVGRVADVQACDFRGVGQLDLVVAEFGWFKTGRVLYLENHTTDWSHPDFKLRMLDNRHGTIHVPVGDIDGDGRPDFVALISQEHETIVAFLNNGDGTFRKETIYTGPHPAYGSSGIQLVDLNGDSKLDVLYTNGDVMDPPYLLKPYHGIQWLENQGRYPFVHHPITPMYGVHRAVAADFRGQGKLDIAAVSYLPADRFPQRQPLGLDAVIYLEQTAPGEFARHSLEAVSCDHVTCAAGDVFGTGKIDLVTGAFVFDRAEHALTIWKNLGEAKGRAGRPLAKPGSD
jgi:hypothetical protein